MYTEYMTKHISTHITALLSGATAIVALIHPGFNLNPVVQAISFTVPALFAAALEALHFLKKHSLEADSIAAVHFINNILAQSEAASAASAAPVVPAAPTGTPQA